MKNNLMTHVVAGYPTAEKCVELMLGMQDAGVMAIEVQIPFSDPSADGPAIMEANDIALMNGTTIPSCFELINAARAKGLRLPLYVMSYVNKVYHFGFKAFCELANKNSVTGLIIPDLPFDSLDYQCLLVSCNNNIQLVPVLSPGMDRKRILGYQLNTCSLVYVTSTKGITGNSFIIDNQLADLTQVIRQISGCKIALGFGIGSSLDVQKALKYADIAVVGSAVTRIIQTVGVKKAIILVNKLVDGTQYRQA